ncbi:hypothetical protein, partial, partial [Parasitella parasitica]
SLFRRKLHRALGRCVSTLDATLSAAQKWEELKRTTASVAKSVSRRQASSLKCAEDLFYRKRSGIQQQITLDPSLTLLLRPQLSVVKEQLSAMQQHHVETLALRSGIRWREKGEVSAGFLKRTASIVHLKEDMLDAAATFHGTLYSSDAIEMGAVRDMLDAIPPSARLSPTAAKSIVEPITFDDLCDAFSRAPSASSPGMDGLPYQLVHLITHPACREIALATFNNALTSSDLPSPWMESCIVLLPKKGPRELLQNW